jgi:hypothetical protein
MSWNFSPVFMKNQTGFPAERTFFTKPVLGRVAREVVLGRAGMRLIVRPEIVATRAARDQLFAGLERSCGSVAAFVRPLEVARVALAPLREQHRVAAGELHVAPEDSIRELDGVRVRERAASVRLTLVTDGRTEFAEVDGVVRIDRRELGGQLSGGVVRLRPRDGEIQLAGVDVRK